MNAKILNRDFQHPADSWYQIEPKGEHLNRRARITQVVDDAAAEAIVNRFNADADAGQLSHGHEMLIDHEHFKHQDDQETRAYGWLQKLQNRDDGIYGQVRWTATGKTAVDGGDYRFFSTEYDPKDLKVLNDGKPRRVRPQRLDGLSLTNDPNNRGGRPITNRSTEAGKILNMKTAKTPASGKCPDCDTKLKPDPDSTGNSVCPDCDQHFVGSVESPDSETPPTVQNKKMKTVCTLLGLSADADENSVHAAVTKLLNRAAELEKLPAENTTLKNRLKPVVLALPTLAERTAALVDFGFKPVEAGKTTRVLNRGGTGAVPQTESAAGDDSQAIAQKITNRAHELKGTGNRTFESCWNQAQREVFAKK